MPRNIQMVDASTLHFDPENPRLPPRLKGASESEVINYMLLDANIIELMGSIASQGFFGGEPLLVVPKTHEAAEFQVVEGNRRLTAIKLILNPALAEKRKTQVAEIAESATKSQPYMIPVVVYSKKSEILEYLGYRHITGVKQWDSIAKARYMQTLYENIPNDNHEAKFKEIAKVIGSKSNYVARILTGLKLYNLIEEKDFFDLEGVNSNSVNFSLLTTALSYKELTTYIGLENNHDIDGFEEIDIDHVKDLTRWIYQKNDGDVTRLGESRNLSKLAKIVASPDALLAFKSQGKSIEDSLIYTDEPSKIFEESLNTSFDSLKTANSQWYLIDLAQISYINTLQEIRQLSVSLRSSIQAKLDSDGEE